MREKSICISQVPQMVDMLIQLTFFFTKVYFLNVFIYHSELGYYIFLKMHFAKVSII